MFSEAAPLDGAHSTESSVRDLLPHTWHAFLAKFGRLTDVQLKAIPLILKGKCTLVCPHTASGKTEAVVVPLIERL